MGASPIIFAVNPGNTTNGFGTGVSNIDHTTLAKFLSGAYGSTNDLSGAAGKSPATVLIREPLSGTYNTTEYTTVDTTVLKLSQDAGNCNGTTPKVNPMHIASTDNASGFRNRVIGTGESIKTLLATKDALGYAFWGASNYKNATATTARYLLVDGYDPLYNPSSANYSTIKNQIPTAGNGYLADVTFTDINNGEYAAWSALRIVTASTGTNYTYANKVAQALQNFVSSTTQPDFIPFNSLTVWRSHFAPPSITVTPNNGNVDGTTCGTEAGGDVGGVILHTPTCVTGERQ